jgi:arylsulfatase A-like enzyme
MRSAYRSEVGFMDRQLGRLFRALERQGLYDRSLIVVAADHGEFLGENGWYGHSYRLDPELIRIPLIVKYPNQRQPVKETRVVSLIDLFPTILDAAGAPETANDGVTLVSPPVSADRRFVISEEHSMGIHRLFSDMKVDDHLYSIDRMKHREVLWRHGHECFRLSKNVWLQEPCTTTQVESEARLREILPQALRELEPEHEVVPDEEERRRLRALGYLE